MLSRLKQIPAEPFRLLLVGSFLLFLFFATVGFHLFPLGTPKIDKFLDGTITVDFGSLSYLGWVAGIYVSYWLIVRITLWVIDGCKRPN